jgi:autotransporter-associated beta strand protein
MPILRKYLPLLLSVVLALSLSSGCGGGKSSASTPSITPPVPATGCFVDVYRKNVSADQTMSNPTIALLSSFGKLWNRTIQTALNSTVLNENLQKVIDITAARTPSKARAAYLDDRREQSYSIINGLGPYTDTYLSKSGATTTIKDMPSDATTVKYDDNGTDAGSTSSTLGNLVQLVKTLRGNYSSTSPAKYYYKYPRPWRQSSSVTVVPELKPAKSANAITDYGFPSGHTNAAYLASIALAYAIPERFQELLTRASELGNNRIVAGMHSPLDVMGGRVMATALAAAILNDSDNATLKTNAYNNAYTYLIGRSGPNISADPFSDYPTNKQNYTKRLTYGFSKTGSGSKSLVVPKGAEVLLETRLPYLDAIQRRWVLYTTSLESSYPVLNDTEGWGRLNLFAAADGYGAFLTDVTVTMAASKGRFNAESSWRNDISGSGKLTLLGTGTLKLTGHNSYSGGTQVDGGILEGDSTSAFGTGNVTISSGKLSCNAAGSLVINGTYTQGSAGTLELQLGNTGNGLLVINGTATLNGTLHLKFLKKYIPSGKITIIACGRRKGQFTSITTEGLADGYTVTVSYSGNNVILKVNQ